MTTAFDDFFQAIQAFHAGHLDRSAALLSALASGQPDHLLYAAARHYVQRVQREGKSKVYASPEGFAAFCDGGGNVPLYQAVSAALREIYLGHDSPRLLDIGVGHGMALLPALTPNLAELTLVDPSEALLEITTAQLEDRGVTYQAYAETLGFFSEWAVGRWEIAQATFSLQSIAPEQRPRLLDWLRKRVDRLLVVEFDVPHSTTDTLSEQQVRWVGERYQRGLAEYHGSQRDLVAQGFLMPVMFGYFDQGSERTNHEQPLEGWEGQLRDAGFAQIHKRRLYDYWWSPAWLLDARSV